MILKRETRNEDICYIESSKKGGEASIHDLRYFPEVVNPKHGNFSQIFHFVVETWIRIRIDPE
jgi:hypothetical protein